MSERHRRIAAAALAAVLLIGILAAVALPLLAASR